MAWAKVSGWLLPPGSRRLAAARRVKVSVYHRQLLRDNSDLRRRLERWAANHHAATIVQIGSHNGRDGDPLVELIDSHPAWRVVFVEPMPWHFAALSAHRGGHDRFTIVQAAVTDHDGEVTMTTVDRTELMPDWADQLTSIHRETVMKHKASVPGLEDAMREVTVPAMTFATLIESAPIETIDLLHIDTEGHDAAILDQIDLNEMLPGVILFENKHLSAGDHQRCKSRLAEAGYELHVYYSDTLATRPT